MTIQRFKNGTQRAVSERTNMFVYNNEVTPTPCEPGVSRKVLTYSDDLMMCEITFEKVQRAIFTSMSIYR